MEKAFTDIQGGDIDKIAEKYKDEYDGYFAMISNSMFMNTVMNKKISGKISLGV